MLSRLLVREGATPRVSGKFYKAVVQAVLLYGSETWVWTLSMFKTLQGFHKRVVRRLAGRLPRLQNGEWVYPPIAEAYEITGIHPIEVYIARRRETFQPRIEGRPIWALCTQSQRLPGTPTRISYYWEQSIDVENHDNPITNSA